MTIHMSKGGGGFFRGMKSDANTKAIVEQWREKFGDKVKVIYLIKRPGKGGDGLPDLLIGFRGMTFLQEVKTETGRLKPEQEKWHNEWQGYPVAVVHSFEESWADVEGHIARLETKGNVQ